MKKLFLFCLLIFLQISFGQIDLKKIDSIFASKIGKDDPSLFVGIVKNGDVIYNKYKGVASLQNPVLVHSESRSNIASVAKQFTAIMVLDLHLKGSLTLEDDIRKFLPKLYKSIPDTIRIRHLINHTSGIRDYPDLMSIQQKPWWRQVGMDNNDVIEDLLSKQESLAFAPESRYMYSNSGYTLLTKIIEVATGKDFHDYSKSFFEELGMKNSAFAKDYMQIIPNQVLPYSDWGDGVFKQYPMLTNLYGDGFLYTTLEDQLIYEQAVQRATLNENELLSMSQKPIPNSEITTYGFGLELSDRLGYKAVHHSGSTGSYHAQTVRIPEENLSVFVMSSNSRIWSGYIADEILKAILPVKDNEPKYDTQINDRDFLSKSQDVVGKYRSPLGTIIRIEKTDDGIQWKMDNNNPMPLDLSVNNLFEMRRWKVNQLAFQSSLEGLKMILFEPNGNCIEYLKLKKFIPTNKGNQNYTGSYYSKELEIGFKITMDDENTLNFQMHGQRNASPLEIIHENDLLYSDYRMTVIRNLKNEVTSIKLTTNRAMNVEFVKQR